ncbi:hypothetical protein AK812_SmicGene5103 [Symbiodinium microadriaticum]|uniref:Uncharacterized protein n=1 Tax=Symbiodinium microadriaticum TaxID=2951 RepID=A0A1Q9EUM7_SYMMI|nr:hypothetical protein AK812_SmicGene5103 [Symbiodinium microadriaticum]
MYNAVKGGVPTPEDVAAAIDDLEGLYRACADSGRLAEAKFDFMKALVTLGTPYQEQLKVDDVINIAEKVAFQPPAVDVIRHDVFPAA